MSTLVFETPSIPLSLRSPTDFWNWLLERMTESGGYAIITYDEIAALAASWNIVKEEDSNGKDY